MLDFKDLEKPEGLTDAMLADSKVQTFIQGMIDSQKTAAVSQVQAQLDASMLKVSIADQKVVDVRAQLETAKKAKPGDSKEHTAALEALQAQLADKETALTKFKGQLDTADVSQYLNTQIAEYNAKNPTVKIVGGAESYVLDAALATFKKNDAGQIVPFKGDAVLTGQSGFMTGVEFISQFRAEKPLFFTSPAGGGASGGKGGGAGNKEMTRAALEQLPHMEQGKAAITHTIID